MRRSHGGYSGKSRFFETRGKSSIPHSLKEFKEGDKARIRASPSAMKGGLKVLKYNNRTVEVVGKQGAAYKVAFNDGGKEKFLVLSNVNLRKL